MKFMAGCGCFKTVKNFLPAVAGVLLMLLTGCVSSEVLPSEDIEVPQRYSDLISILKNPSIPANSKEKYDAVKELISKVDFTFTREVKTLNDLLGSRDAIIDDPYAANRIVTYNYQYGDKYIRLKFYTYNIFVHRVDITSK